MGAVSEQLTAQFYQWEQRGRGWHYFEEPVDPEPHFHPFFFHFVQPQVDHIDDGRRHTIVSWLGDVFKSKPKPQTKPPTTMSNTSNDDWVPTTKQPQRKMKKMKSFVSQVYFKQNANILFIMNVQRNGLKKM